MINAGHEYMGAKRDGERINKQIRHLMNLQKQGLPQQYYIGASGHVKLKFNGSWWDWEKLEKHLTEYQGWENA